MTVQIPTLTPTPTSPASTHAPPFGTYSASPQRTLSCTAGVWVSHRPNRVWHPSVALDALYFTPRELLGMSKTNASAASAAACSTALRPAATEVRLWGHLITRHAERVCCSVCNRLKSTNSVPVARGYAVTACCCSGQRRRWSFRVSLCVLHRANIIIPSILSGEPTTPNGTVCTVALKNH